MKTMSKNVQFFSFWREVLAGTVCVLWVVSLTLCQKYYFNGGRHFNAYLQNSYFNGAAL